jgi:protein TonB
MKIFSWLVSMTVHGLILLIGGISLQQAIVGIAPGRNSIEINLVASPSEPVPPVVTPPQPSPEPSFSPPTQTVVPPLPEIQPPPVEPIGPAEPAPTVAMISPLTLAPAASKPSQTVAKSHKQHAAASNTGKDAVTAQSVAGAIIDEEPDYLSNPAPIYPQAARDQDQEGLVTLDVIVGTDGRSKIIKVLSGSGYYLLDDAAREAVQHYQFRPAVLNGFKVRAHVQVPIRFRLNN